MFRKVLPKPIPVIAYILGILLLYWSLDLSAVRPDIISPAEEAGILTEQPVAAEPEEQDGKQENQK